MTPLLPLVLVATLVVGVVATLAGLADRPPGRGLLRAVLALQLLLLVQAGVAVARYASGSEPSHAAQFVGYLAVSLLLLPGAFALIVEERTRWGSFVLGAACLVVAVVEQRLGATG